MIGQAFKPGTEGTFYDLPDPDYRKAPGVSNSMLKHIASTGEEPGSPAHYQQYLKDPTRMTRPLLLGRLAHAAILRPEDPMESVVLQPLVRKAEAEDSAVKQGKVEIGEAIAWSNNSKVCKRWHDDQAAAGRTVLTGQEYETLVGVIKAIAGHGQAAAALAQGHAEVSVFKEFWHAVEDKRRMVLRKARMDWVSAGNSIVDVKTTTDARREEFGKQMFKMRYHVQSAFYLDCWNEANPDDQKTTFVFIAAEKKPPFAVSVFQVAERALEAGRDEYHRNLNVLLTCMEMDDWPSYSQDILAVDLPPYAYRKEPGVFTPERMPWEVAA